MKVIIMIYTYAARFESNFPDRIDIRPYLPSKDASVSLCWVNDKCFFTSRAPWEESNDNVCVISFV